MPLKVSPLPVHGSLSLPNAWTVCSTIKIGGHGRFIGINKQQPLNLNAIPKMGLATSTEKGIGKASTSIPAASGDASGQIDYSSINDEEWKKRLTKEQYEITRKKGTERAFTGEYWNTKTPGSYHCVCCNTPLFDSDTKFDSGTGWPSYFQPIGNNVKSKMDLSIIFMPRQEVLCATCDAHLGHVFDDGPPPTGKRYCINSASLKLKPK